MGHTMLGIDADVGHLRFWIASGAAALLVLVCALALDWTRTRIIGRFAVVGIGTAFGAILAWAFLAGASVRDQSAERRNLELRAVQLTAQALAPGSPLACLDGMAGENVEAACEKSLFAGQVSVAAASSFIAARLNLLADVAAYYAGQPMRNPNPATLADAPEAIIHLVEVGDPDRNIPPCGACHRHDVGGPIDAPVLSEQRQERTDHIPRAERIRLERPPRLRKIRIRHLLPRVVENRGVVHKHVEPADLRDDTTSRSLLADIDPFVRCPVPARAS